MCQSTDSVAENFYHSCKKKRVPVHDVRYLNLNNASFRYVIIDTYQAPTDRIFMILLHTSMKLLYRDCSLSVLVAVGIILLMLDPYSSIPALGVLTKNSSIPLRNCFRHHLQKRTDCQCIHSYWATIPVRSLPAGNSHRNYHSLLDYPGLVDHPVPTAR